MPKFLPTSTSTFADIINGGFLYIDKTKYVYELVRQPKGAWFLSRPRRFGKSLFVSTLEELFRGNRELFKDLWIDDSDYGWEEHAVIRFDFNLFPQYSADELRFNIKQYLKFNAQNYGIELDDGPAHIQFGELIRTLSKERQVVILIDEYDKPLIDNLDNLDAAREILKALKGFYGVIKAMDRHIRMSFITGISKFSKVGVFSDLNNLRDLSMRDEFATAFGLTESEIRLNLAEYITLLAKKEGLGEDELMDKIRQWYNGFCFSPEGENVYNPFSTLNLFDHRRFSNFWFESGSPSFLIKLIQKENYTVENLNDMTVPELSFSTYEIDQLDVLPLLFQTGYLTIKSYDSSTQNYRLGYPNYEVENAFMTYLLDAVTNTQQAISLTYVDKLIQALKDNNLAQFFDTVKIFFANIDYDLHLKNEKYYQSIFFLVFKLMGLRINAEVKTNVGRIDAVAELEDRIYIFEFKIDQTAEAALRQIHDNDYARKYQGQSKPITGVGINFNTELRTVDDWDTIEIT